MANVRRSLIFSIADKYCMTAINMISAMILSRLLTPRETGIFTIGVAFVGFAHILRDFGVSNYLIQEKELTEARVRSTLGLTLITSWSMGALLALCSGPIAAIYHEPAVQRVTLVLSLNFFIIPFGAMPLILMRREMNFAAIYRVNVASAVVHAITAVALALDGFSYMCVAWSSVAGNLTVTVMAYVERPSHLKVRPSLGEWRRIASYGVFMSGANLIGELGTRVPDLVVGRTLGFSAVGLLSKANSFTTIFNEGIMAAINPVATSSLAMVHRSGLDLKGDFLRMVSYVTALAWPFFAVSAVLMFPIIRVLFGDQWDAAIPLAQTLCVAAFISAAGNMNGTAFTATGAVRRQLSMQSIVQITKIVLVAATGFFALEAVAAALVMVAVVQIVISYRYLRPLIGLRTAEIIDATAKSLKVTVFSLIAPMILVVTIRPDHPPFLLWLVLGFSGAALGWLAGIFLFEHPVKKEILRLASSPGKYFWRRQGISCISQTENQKQ
jgi:O-antigen/teichoic acid export membrane protein